MSDSDFMAPQFPLASMAMSDFPDDDGSDRLLNQDEINSFFGGGNDDSPKNASGLQCLIGVPRVSYERLPMLEVVFDRMVRLLTTSARNFTNDNVDVSMDRLSSQRFGDYLDSVPEHTMFAIFKAEEWDNYGILVLSSSLIYTIVDALLGGSSHLSSGGFESRARLLEGRSHTTIERALIMPLIEIALRDLAESFSPLCAVNFRFDRLELNPRFAAICRVGNGVVMARFCVDMAGRGGDLDIILPHATLEPVRDTLLQQFMGEKFGHDEMWETHLAKELWQTDVTLDAMLAEQTMNLKDIMSLSPGDKLVFRPMQQGCVQLQCGGRSLFQAKMGRSHGNVAVRINEKISRSERADDQISTYS